MHWLEGLRVRLRSLANRGQFEAELDDEVRFHIEMQTEQLIDAGLSPEAARREALRSFGGIEGIKDQTRETVGILLMETIWQDIRYGVRMLARSRAFTLVAVVTLALGIGANTAIFSVVHAILLRPLPYPAADRIAMLWQANPSLGYDEDQAAPRDVHSWIEQSQTFEKFGFVVNDAPGTRNHVLIRGDGSERIRGRFATAGLFDVLGVPPLIGRTISEDEYVKEADRSVVLSHRLWERSFGADPDVVGQTIRIEPLRGKSATIVGVMPPEFAFPQDCDAWLSFSGHPFHTPDRLVHECWTIGRLKPGVTMDAAEAELNLIQGQLAKQHPDAPQVATNVKVVPLLEQFVGSQTKPALLLLLGTVGGVLLIACANVANLLLSRALARRKEIAVRISLGAGRVRVIRQLLTEGLLLASIGAAVGIGIAYLGIQVLPTMTVTTGGGIKEFRVDRFPAVRLDPVVLGFTLLISVGTSLIFGLIPAMQASRVNLNEALKEEGRGSTHSASRLRIRNALLVVEVSLAMLLVVWASLMVQSFRHVLERDPGFEPDRMLTATIDLAVAQRTYSGSSHEITQEIIGRLLGVPGVESVGAIGELPTKRSGGQYVLHVEGRPEVPISELPTIDARPVMPGYFETMQIPLLTGRYLQESDGPDNEVVVCINETAARRYFPDEDPIGKSIIVGHTAFPIMKQPRCRIVGVVGDVQTFSTEMEIQPEVFRCFLQRRAVGGGEAVLPVLVRTSGNPLELVNAMRHAVEGDGASGRILASEQEVSSILSNTAGQHRFRTLLMSLFAVLALVLAVIGIYGVMSYTVSQRTSEIGIRMALGAQPTDILVQVVGSGMTLCAVGIAAGLAVAIAGGQVLSSMLYEIEPADPATLAGVGAVLIVTGLLACFIPARRAMQIDPMEALRCE